MRIHLLSLALRFLKGERTIHGRVVFETEKEAVEVLRKGTGQDFGTDAEKWGAWLRQNRKVYSRIESLPSE